MSDTHCETDVERGSSHSNDAKGEKDLPNPYADEDDDRDSESVSSVGKKEDDERRVVEEPVDLVAEANMRRMQQLQDELGDFLAQHVAKTLNLQNSLHPRHGDPLRMLRKRGSTFERENASIVSPGSTGIAALSHDAPLSRLDLDSNRGGVQLGPHTAAVDKFLRMHLQNIQMLQDSLHRSTGTGSTKRLASKIDAMSRDTIYGATALEFSGLIANSILEAILIVAFLQFAYAIMVTRNHGTPFSVAMLFSFFCLVFLFLSLCLSLWGIMLSSWRHLKHEPDSQVRCNFYLFLGRQLQFCSTVAFILPFLILSFCMFSSIAFPVVLVVFMLVVSMLMLGSVVYRVPISLENVSAIVLNGKQKDRSAMRTLSWGAGRRTSLY